MVYPRICGGVRLGIDLWLPAGRLALRRGGGSLGGGRCAAMAPSYALGLRLRAARRRGFVPRGLCLHRRAGHRAVRTEDAAMPGLRPQHGPAPGAFVKELARIGRHRFRFRGGAMRAGDDGLMDHRVFSNVDAV